MLDPNEVAVLVVLDDAPRELPIDLAIVSEGLLGRLYGVPLLLLGPRLCAGLAVDDLERGLPEGLRALAIVAVAASISAPRRPSGLCSSTLLRQTVNFK